MAPPQQLRQQTSNCSLLLIYRPRKDERLSRPSWLAYSGWFTHISGHPSATSRAQDSERTPAKDRYYTAGPRNQPRPPPWGRVCMGRWLCTIRRKMNFPFEFVCFGAFWTVLTVFTFRVSVSVSGTQSAVGPRYRLQWRKGRRAR